MLRKPETSYLVSGGLPYFSSAKLHLFFYTVSSILEMLTCQHITVQFHNVLTEKSKESCPHTFAHLGRGNGSSYLHEFHLLSIICLLKLTFMGPSWHLWFRPILSERLWKQPSAPDFTAAWNPLSSKYALILHVMCTCTHVIYKCIRWIKGRKYLKANKKWLQKMLKLCRDW